VADVLNIEEENISPPAVLGGFASRYISGIGKVDGKVKLLLDCEKLFTDEETELLDQASQS
jgi:purine-binding chemotaxis protein CheW